MSKLVEVMQVVIDDIPEQARFSTADAEVIIQHKDYLLGLEDALVQGFYDTLFAFDRTRDVFHEGERPARENSLAKWWQRTVQGPFDEGYWAWQTYVGLLHIKRGVSNPMMISMWSWVLDLLSSRIEEADWPSAEKNALNGAFQRMAAMTEALIGDSVFRFYLQGLMEATGFNQKLLDRMVQNEIDQMLEANAQYRLEH